MGDLKLRLYHCLPPRLRNIAASVRGYRLQSLRYGPESERLVHEALEREHWPADRWKQWQAEQLGRMLHHAATQVPYYRKSWSERRRRGDRASWDYLENWPVLTKQDLRENTRAFLTEGIAPRQLHRENTSGSTGKSLDLWHKRDSIRAWYALCEARLKRAFGLTRHDRWAILGGQLVAPVGQTKPPFWVWNQGMRQLYMSAYHLSPALAPYYGEALIRYGIRYLLGYPSAIDALAQALGSLFRDHLAVEVVVTNAEELGEGQRYRIEKAFGCPVRESYGLCEVVTAASECSHGTMHLWPDVGVVEVLDCGFSCAPGTTGDLIATGLLTPEMPLIRYATGDRTSVAPSSSCACGRTLPVFGRIEGRKDDVLWTREGRQIGRLDTVFKGFLPVREAQIVQESLSAIRVRVVPDDGYSTATEEEIRSGVQARMGSVDIIVEPVANIERGANGKFHGVVCRLSAEERQMLQRQPRQVEALQAP